MRMLNRESSGMDKLFMGVWLASSMGIGPGLLEADEVTHVEWNGDGKADATAYSDLYKPNIGFRYYVNNTVFVPPDADPALTSLGVVWDLPAGHKLKATLPFGGQWSFNNEFSFVGGINGVTVKIIDADLELSPTTVPAVAPFTKTARAIEPVFIAGAVLDAIGLLGSDDNCIGGESRMLAADWSPTEPGSDDVQETPLDDLNDLRLLEVQSCFLATADPDTYEYRYTVTNRGASSASGSWILDPLAPEDEFASFDVLLPGQSSTVKSVMTSSGDTEQVFGSVQFEMGGVEFSMGVPTFIPVPEPATLAMLVLGGLGVTCRRRKP